MDTHRQEHADSAAAVKRFREMDRFWAVTGATLSLAVIASGFSWNSSAQFHMVCETIAICCALFAAAIGWERFRDTEQRSALLISCTFFATAVLDIWHVVVTSPSVASQLPDWMSSSVVWSWLGSRMVLGVGLYLSWLVETDERVDQRLNLKNTPFVVALIAIVSVVMVSVLPFSQSAYANLLVYRPAEWIPGAFFALALVGYWRRGRWMDNPFERWLVGSLVLATLTQWFVMPFSLQWYDSRFDVAHLLKIVSYAMVAVGWLAELSQSSHKLEQLQREHESSISELARANEGLRVFVRSASHDLKAPIRHIAGFSEFLLEDAKDRLNAEEAEDLRRIREAAQHMSKLLESLLRFAKFDAGSLQPTQFSVNQAVDAALVQLPANDQMRVTCADLGDIVGDQSLLTLVFQNLIENGLKYTRKADSKVVVRSETIDEGVLVSVSDDGIGVDPEQSNRIFEPGVRAVGESEFTGTGFGLATCARIIQAHEGKIWVEPNPEHGSTFKFILPTATATV
ncbi:MAG: ATP-binding protein [Planctomycetota bacterium]